MDLEHALRTTASARRFTSREVTGEMVERICELARFAPSGGNRQPWSVIDVRDTRTRAGLRDLAQRTWGIYKAHGAEGRVMLSAGHDGIVHPWPEDLSDRRSPDPFIDEMDSAPALLAVCSDMRKVAAMDALGPIQSIAGGASIYPFVDRILLAARLEGLGGVITTFPCPHRAEVVDLLGLPPYVTLAALVVLGEPERTVTRLNRQPVSSFLYQDRWGG